MINKRKRIQRLSSRRSRDIPLCHVQGIRNQELKGRRGQSNSVIKQQAEKKKKYYHLRFSFIFTESCCFMGKDNNETQPTSISMQYFDSDTPSAEQTLVVLKKKVRYLALCFMILFTSFNAAQNLVQSLYKQQGYQYLGLSSLLVLYAVFAIFSLFAKYLMNNRSYR